MEDDFLSVEECNDLVNPIDQDTVELINNAEIAYYNAIKVFPGLKKDEFLSAFLAGYHHGILKGVSTLQELVM